MYPSSLASQATYPFRTRKHRKLGLPPAYRIAVSTLRGPRGAQAAHMYPHVFALYKRPLIFTPSWSPTFPSGSSSSRSCDVLATSLVVQDSPCPTPVSISCPIFSRSFFSSPHFLWPSIRSCPGLALQLRPHDAPAAHAAKATTGVKTCTGGVRRKEGGQGTKRARDADDVQRPEAQFAVPEVLAENDAGGRLGVGSDEELPAGDATAIPDGR
ncbi:hypothetical protein OF83DRAFT_73976 [Amylostereum chailletii]|nr:hypothetical protein OF83DRAFT_73976 [Amylostereum chailletii]